MAFEEGLLVEALGDGMHQFDLVAEQLVAACGQKGGDAGVIRPGNLFAFRRGVELADARFGEIVGSGEGLAKGRWARPSARR